MSSSARHITAEAARAVTLGRIYPFSHDGMYKMQLKKIAMPIQYACNV
jgi:hypothetical protein